MISKIKKEINDKEVLRREIEDLECLASSEFATAEQVEKLNGKIVELQGQLFNGGRLDFSSIAPIVEKYDLSPEMIQHSKFVYLYPGLIVQNEITMIAAKPASGKTLISIALGNMMLKNGIVNRVMYFDADNGLSTLKDRGVGRLKLEHGDSLHIIHESLANLIQMWQLIHKLQTVDLKDMLIVFDSIKNFMRGGDRDKNKDVSRIMQNLKRLRNQGATIIFLHHTNKPQADIAQLRYAGSSAWEEDTSNAFILNKNEYRKCFVLSPIKTRIGDLKEIAFTFDQEKQRLNEVDLFWAKETRVDEEMRKEVIHFLRESETKPIYSDIMRHLREIGYKNNDKINRVIQAGKNVIWKATKVPDQNFKDVYELIEDYSDKSDKSSKET